MKKTLLVLSLILFVGIVSSCKSEEVINKEDVRVNFSVYDLLPQTFTTSSEVIQLSDTNAPKHYSLSHYCLLLMKQSMRISFA